MDNHAPPPGRFLISYAHESPEHMAAVRRLCDLLRAEDLDVRLDVFADEDRQDWPIWTMREIAAAQRVLVIASPRYRARFEATAPVDEGRGVQLEGLLIREEIVRDMATGLRRFVPVLLPGGRIEDIPTMLQPYSATHYPVAELTAAGVERIVRLLRRDPLTDPDPAPSEGGGPVAAIRLSVDAGTPAEADAAVRELLVVGGDEAEVAIDFDDGTRSAGAVLQVPAGAGAAALTGTVRHLCDVLRQFGRLRVTVGAHVAASRAAATTEADCLAAGEVARRMHAVPGAGLVVVLSPDAHRMVAASGAPYPGTRSYREWPLGGDRGRAVFVAVPGRSQCPELPPAVATREQPPGRTTTTHIGGHNFGAVGDGNSVTYNGPVTTGHVVTAGRDAYVRFEDRA